MKIPGKSIIGSNDRTSFRSMRQLLASKLEKRKSSASKRNRIRNSKGETFQQYWERVKKTGDLGAEINPLNWSMETEREKAFTRKFKRMSNRELGVILLELSSKVGEHFPLNDNEWPLGEFVDRLDDYTFNNLYFANLPAHLQMARGMLREFEVNAKYSDELVLNIKKSIEAYERAKALIFEIVSRWNRN